MDRDFQQELDSHLTMMAEDNVRRGMSPEQARRAALIRLGGPVAIQEQHRAVRGLPSVEATLQDVRFAFRLMARIRGSRPPPSSRWRSGSAPTRPALASSTPRFLEDCRLPIRIAFTCSSWQARQGYDIALKFPDLQEARSQSRTFASLAGYRSATMNVSDDRGLPEEVRGAWLTINTFGLLRQQPSLGRDFVTGDDRPGAESVVIIGERLWKQRYGADPEVIGSSLRLNGQPATVVASCPGA